MRKIVKLSGSFMFASAAGLIISFLYIYELNPSWGIALGGLFGFMLLSAVVSFIHAPVED